MKSRWFLILVAILGLALFAGPGVPVATAATPSIKLVLGGTGSTPWAIGSVAPGDNGTKSVTLSNTGFNSGVVTIWISDIVNGEGTNPQSETGNISEPGELGNYMLFNVSGANLSADFIMPAKISDFPQSANDTKYIYLNPLKAFSTVNLQWEWQLPLATGDDIQGDNLSFTINYMLEEIPPQPLPPLPTFIGGGTPGAKFTTLGITQGVSPDVVVGLTGSYTMSMVNTGTATLNDVVVTGYLPDLLNYQSSIPPGTVAGNQITWNLGTLNAGAAKEIVVILSGVKPGTAVITLTMTAREGVISTGSFSVTVLGEPDVQAPSTIPPPVRVEAPPPPLQAAPVQTLVTPTGNDTVTTLSLPPAIPAPSAKQTGMSMWLIPAILAGIGVLALVYYIVTLVRRRRWDWIPYTLTTRAGTIMARTAEWKTIHTASHQKRVAQLAGAIAREMNLSKTLTSGDILLRARILALSDIVEAVSDTVKRTSSSGSYRLTEGLDKAMEEIKQSSNAVYDSEVIQAFVRLADRGKFRFQTVYD